MRIFRKRGKSIGVNTVTLFATSLIVIGKIVFLFVFVGLYRRTETADFVGCDYFYYLNPGVSYLQSPNFPKSYPPNTSCRYKFKAAENYGITVQCNINLVKGPNGCSTEFFYLARDGDLSLRGSEQLCGSGSLTRKSLFNLFTIAYISKGSTGSFNCSLAVQPQPCDCGWSVNTKIVNGVETNINQYPSMVALRNKKSNMPLYCGGSILSSTIVATAAHCVSFQPNAAYVQILVGRHYIEASPDTPYSDVYDVNKIIVHPNYVAEPTRNDIALMKTSKDIEFRRGVAPICLPPRSNINNDFAYNDVDVIGWGSTKFAAANSKTLQRVTLMVTDKQTCEKAFEDQNQIYPSHICTYDFTGTNKDSCQYDSGGPMILNHKNRQFLIGIISFGKHCGAGGYATGVNERITSHLDWIYQNTEYKTCYVEM